MWSFGIGRCEGFLSPSRKGITAGYPGYQQARTSRATRRFNPVPHHSSYFGHKIHIDQNEKLVIYGVTDICARDGFSGKVVEFVSMPIKNNVEIYNHLFWLVLLFFQCKHTNYFPCNTIAQCCWNMASGTRSVFIRARSGYSCCLCKRSWHIYAMIQANHHIGRQHPSW